MPESKSFVVFRNLYLAYSMGIGIGIILRVISTSTYNNEQLTILLFGNEITFLIFDL